ncbi:MAG: response regulator [Bariatricus sp.]
MKKCFVIMPFSKTTEKHDEEYWTTFFEILRRIMEGYGYSCSRSETGPYKLFSNIVRNLETSDIVIAVLTDLNANVWYELGIRHTLKTGTIMLMQEGSRVPFDVHDFGMVFYKDNLGLEQRLKKAIKDYLDKLEGENMDSPVISTLNSREYNQLEKKLEEMQGLIWRLVGKMPMDASVSRSSGRANRKVLWVDDFPENNRAVLNLFEDKGIHFDLALTTEQGLEFCDSREYGLAITDMGRGDRPDAGIEFLKGIKERRCQMPVVVYTTCKAIQKYGETARRYGAHTVTNKVGDVISVISEMTGL